MPLLLCRFAQTTAAVLLAGTATLRLLARGTDGGWVPRWRGLAWGSLGVLLVAAAAQLGLTAAAMCGEEVGQALADGEVWAVVRDTHFGAVWLGRMGLLTGVIALERVGIGRRVNAARDVAEAGLAAALLATLVWAGHAEASPQSVWLLPVDVLHAIAAGAWPGGLFPLALLLARTRSDPALLPAAMQVTRRFSSLSVAAVGTLALTGLLNAWGLVGTLAALWPGVYGRWLLCKVAIFAGMVGLGAVNRSWLRREEADTATVLRRLRRNVVVECVLAGCVLLATEALATSAPPVVPR